MRKTVHPRWRGEQIASRASSPGCGGSSPLARGTGASGFCRYSPRRFIPAGAGNRGFSRWLSPQPSVHPRWRGEQNCKNPRLLTADGSSPLARGTGHCPPWFKWRPRFIPAGAGNRSPCICCMNWTSVHPRWRGEQLKQSVPLVCYVGSSPLARGTGGQLARLARTRRFIPAGAGNSARRRKPKTRPAGSSPLARGTVFAYLDMTLGPRFIPAGAGNSFTPSAFFRAKAVHPRWRGEQMVAGKALSRKAGSSPLARGTGQLARFLVCRVRFIPAGAGNSGRVLFLPRRISVHPRWRGEQPFDYLPDRLGSGSSPLARGTVQSRITATVLGRFIPAGAGNRESSTILTGTRPVHPRWRGEQAWPARRGAGERGSSPLARGTEPLPP